MSKATKRKHVTKELLDNYDLPTENQTIVKVLGGRGNNLHEVETPDGDTFLASMPVKFRKNVWMKRGCFVIVEPIEEGNKVKAEIVHILLKDQIKYFKEEKIWPSAFDDVKEDDEEEKKPLAKDRGDEDSSSGEELPANPNRPNIVMESDSEEEDSSEEDDEAIDDSTIVNN